MISHTLVWRFALGFGLLFYSLSGFAAEPAGKSATETKTTDQPKTAASAAGVLLYVGTYTGGKSKGIYRFRFDQATGALKLEGTTGGIENPSYLTIDRKGRFLFAAAEVDKFQGTNGGAVASFSIDPKTGDLTLINEESSHGAAPCHLMIDHQQKHVLVANYSSGTVAAIPFDSKGHLSPATSIIQHKGTSANPQRQEGPHAHSINFDASGKFAIAADLGLDKLLVYKYDGDQGTLTPNDPPSASVPGGSGPRHVSFHPNGRFGYVINELNSTLTAFKYDAAKGTIEVLETVSTLPADFKGDNSTAEIEVHPSGKFLYGSNRGDDSIVTFAIDQDSGKLTLLGHTKSGGKTPRNFVIDPTGAYLLAAHQDSDSIAVFRIDQKTGALTDTHERAEVPKAVCITFLPQVK